MPEAAPVQGIAAFGVNWGKIPGLKIRVFSWISCIDNTERSIILTPSDGKLTTREKDKAMTVQTRAKKGGEFGANGEWYEGGKFINTVKENAKQSGSGSYARKPRKVQIEPGVWVEQPYENAKPLLAHVGAGADYICRKTQNYGLKPYLPAFERTGLCYGLTLADMQAICDRYNAGERWE